jgi:hypothetical protein
VDLNVTTLGNAAVGNLTLTGNLNMNVEGFASIITGATANVAGRATLVSPNSVLQQNGNSLGFADKPRTSGNGGSVGTFVLNAARFNLPAPGTGAGALVEGALAVGDLAAPRGLVSVDFEGSVPKAYVIRRPEAPAPTGLGKGYFTSVDRGLGEGGFRVIYPKVNLGQAYYVGARGAEDRVEETAAK